MLLATVTSAQKTAELDPLPSQQQFAPSYVLTWDGTTFPDLQVEARISVEDGLLRTSDFWSTFFEDPRGWAAFVEMQTAFDKDGNAMGVRRGEANDWHIGEKYSGPLSIRYSVDFSFAERRWPAGNEQVAIAVDGGLYTTGLPIFVYGVDAKNIRVRFVLPEDWNLATAWPRARDKTFLVRNLDRLTRNTLAIGR
ncbi:MAG: hypothetical protein MI919_30830, partial [Holophagales bacterium]|nr:hypothetical protein [Holophagales bacterium]